MVQAVVQTTVVALQGNPVSAAGPAANQSLTWNGSAWAPGGPFLSMGGGTLTGPLTLSGNATGALQPVSLQQLQASYLPLTGGALSGNLNVGGGLSVTGNMTMAGSSTFTIGGSGSGYFLTVDTSNNRFLSMAAQYAFIWQATNGQLSWTSQALAGGNAMYITSLGNMTIAGTLSQGSDQTNKTNINPLTQGISLIRQLLPKAFAFNATPNVTQWGFIAQDVESVIPAAVTSSEMGTTTMLGLDTTGILAAVTFALKQIDERLTAVEAHDGITPPAAQLA